MGYRDLRPAPSPRLAAPITTCQPMPYPSPSNLASILGRAAWAPTLGITLLVASGSARAAFRFSSPTPINEHRLKFSDKGINLVVSDPFTGYSDSGGVNTNSSGLCVWLQNASTGPGGRRCNYTGGTSAAGANLSGLSFTFDTRVKLISFVLSRVSGVDNGQLKFNQGAYYSNLIELKPLKIEGSKQYFDSELIAEKNKPITLITAGSLMTRSGVIRINELEVQAVPGPIPVAGALAAFSWSRKIRQKQARR
jgi:hypothetical protein